MLHYAKNQGEISAMREWVINQITDTTPFDAIYGVAVLDNDPPHDMFAGMIYSTYTENNVFISGAIAPDAVGRVTAGDLSKALSVAFDPPLDVLRITALVLDTNKRSAIFMKKLGFTHEGTMRDYEGPDTRTLVFGLTRSEFLGGAYGRRRQRWRAERSSTGLRPDVGRSGVIFENQSNYA